MRLVEVVEAVSKACAFLLERLVELTFGSGRQGLEEDPFRDHKED
jgi:hypothetical protein